MQQADGSERAAGDAVTAFVEFDVDCDADLILGYDWLRAHDLAFLYSSDEVCLSQCARSAAAPRAAVSAST